jgi:membrane protease YdiL (CAAX protease family)
VSIATVFLFGVAMCYVLKRSGSLWSCILVHSTYDFTAFF